ncbi:MAG: hypothetical protein NC311_05745 [Muribaculaceae bacterium]|nr:hypothetical protein [Muribaculaceae bacterium]
MYMGRYRNMCVNPTERRDVLMIAEIFSLLSTVDTSGSGGTRKLRVNLNRNHIRSISAYSSNSIFYFTTCIPDDVTPSEMGMISRMFEKNYASFVVTCISLMPFHRVRADDQASIEEYLSQFHQNLGISATSGSAAVMGKVLGLVDTLEESVQLPISEKAKGRVNEDGDLVPDTCPKCGSKVGVFLQGEPVYLCCNKDCKKYFGVVPFNEAVEDAAVKELQDFLLECWEKSRRNCSDYVKIVSETVSLNDMYQVDPIDPKTRLMQETFHRNMEELDTWGFLGEATADMFDISDEALESMSDAEIIQSVMGMMDGDDDEDGLEDEYSEFDEYLGEAAIGLDLNELRAARKKLHDNWEKEHPGVPMPRGRNRAHDKPLSEGNVKSAIDHIMFSLESVSENKILSCSNLTKLNALESKLNKLKNKYAKYLNRYKKKYQENKKKGSKSKLSIRFNGATISNPKAFMKQYGAYIKIINKRLKLVEKRRAELRKRKGLPASDSKLEEAAMTVLTEVDFKTIDYIDETIQKQLEAPDSEIFVITEARGPTKAELEKRVAELEDQIDDLQGSAWDDEQRLQNMSKAYANVSDQNRDLQKQHAYDERKMDHINTESRKRKMQVDRAAKNLELSRRTEKELKDRIAELEKQKASLEKGRSDPDLTVDGTDVNLDYDRRRPKSGLNYARAAKAGYSYRSTFGDKVFTDMEMKKANEAVPTFTKATIGFIVDETEQVVNRDVLVGIKVQLHKQSAMDMIDDIYNCLINKRKFLKFVKFISGEEKSLADLLFGFKELKVDAANSTGAKRWNSAFRRRKRWAKMSVPYLMKNYTPNGTVVITMNEVQFIRDEYGLDIMTPEHVRMLMDAGFLLGFAVLDQANEMVYVTYDGHGGEFQQYTYAMLEREQQTTDRMMRELYRSMAR